MSNRLANGSTPGRVTAGLLGCVLLLQSFAGLARDDFTLSLSGDLVSIDADEAELRLVLQELSLQSGIRIWIPDHLPAQSVSMRFEDKPMKATLRRLLQGSSYAAVYGDDGEIVALYILPPGSQQSDFPDPATGSNETGQQESTVSTRPAGTDGSRPIVTGANPAPQYGEDGQHLSPALQSSAETRQTSGNGKPLTPAQIRALYPSGDVAGKLFAREGEDTGDGSRPATLSEALGEIDQSLLNSYPASPETIQQLQENLESGAVQPSGQ